MKKNISMLLLLLTTTLIISCGKATVEPSNESYEPQIVVEGFLEANQDIDRIYITRNFPIDADLTRLSMLPDPDQSEVSVIHLESGTVFELSYYQEKINGRTESYWRNSGESYIINEGDSYQLVVSTVIDDTRLTASAITIVPSAGFSITRINHETLKYRQKHQNGELMQFAVDFNRSPGSSFYLAAISAQNPSLETFIYDNPYDDRKPDDVDLIDDGFNYTGLHHVPQTAGESTLRFSWDDFRFYDEYKIIMYATDENYKDYMITYRNVMEMDGNFHEAKFNIEGDGIGVFGSVSADTVYCRVVN